MTAAGNPVMSTGAPSAPVCPFDVSVIVVTYNSRTFIDDCLASVAASHVGTELTDDTGLAVGGGLSVETVVVDNASQDGTSEHLDATWTDATVVHAGWNSGFSRACNLGARVATGTYLLFLNGDAQLEPGGLSLLHDSFLAMPTAGVMAPKVLNPDGTDQRTARSFPTAAAFLWGRRSPLTRRFPNNRFSTRYLSGADTEGDEPFQVDWVSGAALMIERERFLELDGFDEGFFMYWEDADLCRRVHAAGASVWCLPSAHVRHAEGSSAPTTSKLQNKRFHQSAYRYVCKHMLRGPAAALRPLARVALWARSIGVAIARRKNAARADTAFDTAFDTSATTTTSTQELNNGIR